MKVKYGETSSIKILQTQPFYSDSRTHHNLGIETTVAVYNYKQILLNLEDAEEAVNKPKTTCITHG